MRARFFKTLCIYIFTEKFSLYFTHLPRRPARELICMTFGTGGHLADVINCVKFCDDRIRGFDSARGRILAIFIDLGLGWWYGLAVTSWS